MKEARSTLLGRKKKEENDDDGLTEYLLEMLVSTAFRCGSRAVRNVKIRMLH